MYKVSIIVPIYNVKDYIRECIISILNQTLKDIEIILVNDGSTDSSIDEIRDIIEQYRNIKLINKENGGLSSARNEGLKFAKGDYIAFIDSDDYIEPYFIKELYDEGNTNNLDICIGGYKTLVGSKLNNKVRNKELLQQGICSGIEFINKEIKLNDYRMMVWFKLYKREFLIDNNIYFYNGLIYEDEAFTPKAFSYAKKVKIIENFGYIYRQREGSITSNKINKKNLDSLIVILKEFIKLYHSNHNKSFKLTLKKLISSILTKLILLTNKSDININYIINEIPKKEIFNIYIKNIENIKDFIKAFVFKINIKVYMNMCTAYFK